MYRMAEVLICALSFGSFSCRSVFVVILYLKYTAVSDLSLLVSANNFSLFCKHSSSEVEKTNLFHLLFIKVLHKGRSSLLRNASSEPELFNPLSKGTDATASGSDEVDAPPSNVSEDAMAPTRSESPSKQQKSRKKWRFVLAKWIIAVLWEYFSPDNCSEVAQDEMELFSRRKRLTIELDLWKWHLPRIGHRRWHPC